MHENVEDEIVTGEYDPNKKGVQVYYHPKDKKMPPSCRRVIIRQSVNNCTVASVFEAERIMNEIQRIHRLTFPEKYRGKR